MHFVFCILISTSLILRGFRGMCLVHEFKLFLKPWGFGFAFYKSEGCI